MTIHHSTQLASGFSIPQLHKQIKNRLRIEWEIQIISNLAVHITISETSSSGVIKLKLSARKPV